MPVIGPCDSHRSIGGDGRRFSAEILRHGQEIEGALQCLGMPALGAAPVIPQPHALDGARTGTSVFRAAGVRRAAQQYSLRLHRDQVETYLDPCVQGERLDCLALTEPDAGSDLRAMATRAVRDGDDFVINGTKHFISHSDIADFVILFAVTGVDETPRGPRKCITCFLVDKEWPGFEVRRGPGCVSHRGYHQCALVFTDCRVSAQQILGEEGKGFELAEEWLGASRLTVAAMCVGRAQRALEMALEWAATRTQFGQPIGRFQGTSFKLADMATEIAAAELLTLNTAWKLDQGTMTPQDAAMAKLYASEMLGRVTDHTLQIFGGMGLMDELPIERFWRDARVERIWDGTSEIQRHLISRALLRPYER